MALERTAELSRVVPDMRRELRPPEDAFAVEQFLIMQVVRLMSITESIETEVAHHFHSGLNLLIGESMTLAELMFIFTDAINQYWLTIEEKAVVAIFTSQRPGNGAESKVGMGAFGCLPVALDNRIHIIEVRLFQRP